MKTPPIYVYPTPLKFSDAESLADKLNASAHWGCTDWILPTIDQLLILRMARLIKPSPFLGFKKSLFEAQFFVASDLVKISNPVTREYVLKAGHRSGVGFCFYTVFVDRDVDIEIPSVLLVRRDCLKEIGELALKMALTSNLEGLLQL